MDDLSNLEAAHDGEPTAQAVAVVPPAKRELGFVAGGPIPDSFFDVLSDNELSRWESA